MKTTQWSASLKNLRSILGVTQAELAELAGVATITIKKAEARGGEVSRKVGAQIQMATGAIIGESKLTPDGYGPYEPLPGNIVISKWCSYQGRVHAAKFTRKDFERHWKLERESAGANWTGDMVKTLTAMIEAAPKANANLHALRWSFIQWAQEAIVRFKLPMSPPPATPSKPH